MKYEIDMPEGCSIRTLVCWNPKSKDYEHMANHAVPVKEVEPLAVLADRKGKSLLYVGPYYTCKWVIAISNDGLNGNCVVAPTYSECEAKARAYLESIEDVKGGR